MIEEKKSRVCIVCGKKLIDEKIPVCLRCKLKGRNTGAKAGEFVGGIVLAVGATLTLANNKKDNDT